MTKPGGLLVYNFNLTNAIQFLLFETVAGAPSQIDDVYNDRFAAGVIKRSPVGSENGQRKIATWASASGGSNNTAGVRLRANFSETLDAAGFLVSLIIGVDYSGPALLAAGQNINGLLFVSIPNFQNVGL